MKVLLVEPDKILQKTYANALESSGNIVVSASSAQQALNELNINKKFRDRTFIRTKIIWGFRQYQNCYLEHYSGKGNA